MEDIVRYANKRGIRVLPEFDSPAHVGAGWEAVDPSFTLCVNRVGVSFNFNVLLLNILPSGTLGRLVY